VPLRTTQITPILAFAQQCRGIGPPFRSTSHPRYHRGFMGNLWPVRLAALDSFALRHTGHAGWIGCPRVDHFIGILAIAQIRLKSHGTSSYKTEVPWNIQLWD
jgi:hypothetical protein